MGKRCSAISTVSLVTCQTTYETRVSSDTAVGPLAIPPPFTEGVSRNQNLGNLIGSLGGLGEKSGRAEFGIECAVRTRQKSF